MTREEQLKYEYECKLMALRTEQNNCQHDWKKIVYDPEFKYIPKFEDKFVGSDYMPELVGYDEKKVSDYMKTLLKLMNKYMDINYIKQVIEETKNIQIIGIITKTLIIKIEEIKIIIITKIKKKLINLIILCTKMMN